MTLIWRSAGSRYCSSRVVCSLLSTSVLSVSRCSGATCGLEKAEKRYSGRVCDISLHLRKVSATLEVPSALS